MRTLTKLTGIAAVAMALCHAAVADEPDPVTHYFYDGELVGPRNMQVGDPSNWNSEVRAFPANSEGGKVVVTRDTYRNPDDAVHLSFSEASTQGQFAIYGPEVDLSPFEAEGMLIMELKIDKMSKSPVMLAMDCNWPCRSESDVRKQLRRYPKGEWFTFAVPLDCFTKDKSPEQFDISRVNGPLLWMTTGQLEMSLADVRLALLPVGESGCQD